MNLKTIYENREIADQLGLELDAIRNHIMASRGEDDARYILKVIRWQRSFAVIGRTVIGIALAFHPTFGHSLAGWGTLTSVLILGGIILGVAKILENMEIGHNVLHGQWDWMGHPEIQSGIWEWDAACPADQWKHSHNVIHHTWTNVIGRDRDVGYGIMRMSPMQPWEPRYLGQVFYNVLLALGFEVGVAFHDLELDKVVRGERDRKSIRPMLRIQGRKIANQFAKDYLLFPALSGPFFFYVAGANLLANILRNVWAYSVIFCGHFPEGCQMFTEDEIKGESRGQWYVRQMMGSCNFTGGKLLHILSGNLSHQIEHHLFPDLPSNRYQEISPLVQHLAKKYGIPYNSRSFLKQFASTIKAIVVYSFPTPKVSVPRSEQKENIAA